MRCCGKPAGCSRRGTALVSSATAPDRRDRPAPHIGRDYRADGVERQLWAAVGWETIVRLRRIAPCGPGKPSMEMSTGFSSTVTASPVHGWRYAGRRRCAAGCSERRGSDQVLVTVDQSRPFGPRFCSPVIHTSGRRCGATCLLRDSRRRTFAPTPPPLTLRQQLIIQESSKRPNLAHQIHTTPVIVRQTLDNATVAKSERCAHSAFSSRWRSI